MQQSFTEIAIQTLSLAELQLRRQHNPHLVLVEALPVSYYASGHLPGAVHLPHDAADSVISRTLSLRTAEIVVYCASATCPNSHVLAQRLKGLGYADVAVFAEGKAGWSQAGQSFER